MFHGDSDEAWPLCIIWSTWRKACRALDLRPIRTKPFTPRTNGKVERFIQTLYQE